MNILCLNVGAPARALREQGHTVLELSLRRGVHKLAPHLEQHGFAPDLFVQMELLGERVLCSDLPSLPCPRAFWSVDTHLNLYWQAQYGKLFDAFLTPHLSFVRNEPRAAILPGIRHLPWWGERLAWTPHTERRHDISFVGRLTSTRPLRAWLAELLRETHGVAMQDGLSRQDMLDLYMQTRLLPNESIAFETNFRILEGASAGCCVLTPDVGEDQNAQFEPGTECLVYRDGLELLELLDFCRRRPAMAERVGLAAQRRVQACHLVENRANSLAELAAISRAGAKGEAAVQALWLTVAQVARDQNDTLLNAQADANLARLPQNAEVLAMRLQLNHEAGNAEITDRLLREALARDGSSDSDNLSLELAGFGTAALQGNLELARIFSQRRRKAADSLLPDVLSDNLASLCLDWARELAVAGRDWQPGFQYVTGRHCPGSAFELILLARILGAPEMQCAALTSALPSVQRHLVYAYMANLAQMVLGKGNDWRFRTDLGLAYLRGYRVREGLEELTLAQEQARKDDQAEVFADVLRAGGAHILSKLNHQAVP